MIFALPIAAALASFQATSSTPASASLQRSLPVMVEPVTSFGAAALGGELYVLGGHAGAAHDYSRENQSRAFLRLDLNAPGSWELLQMREHAVQSVALVADQRSLFAVGGMEARNARNEPLELWSIRETLRFDPAHGIWSPLPELPTARSSHAAAVAAGKLWVIGGWELAGGDLDSGGTFCDSICSIDLAAPVSGWSMTPAPFQRRGLAAAANSSILAAIGGMEAGGRLSTRVDLLDLRTLTWSRGPDLPEEGFGCAAVASDERIFVGTPSGAIFELEADSSAWKPVAKLDFPRRFYQLVAQDKRTLVALGGTSAGQHIAHLERVQLGGAPVMRVTSVKARAPGKARNRQAMWVQGDSLFLFGGNTGTTQHDFAPERFSSEGWRLDLGSLTWTRLADLPVRRQSLVALSLTKDRCLVAGGFGRSEIGTRSFSDAFSYDATLDAWTPAGSLGISRTQFALLGHAGKAFVLGGVDFDDARAKAEQFSYVLALLERGADGEFRELGAKLPRQRRAFGSAVSHGAAYLVGGMTDGFEAVDECDVYDFERGSWSTIPQPRKPRISPDLIALGERLYLIGGSSSDDDGELHPDRSIECFDPQSRTWSVLIEDVGVDVQQARAFVHRERLLLVSTQHGPEEGVSLTWIATPPVRSTPIEATSRRN